MHCDRHSTTFAGGLYGELLVTNSLIDKSFDKLVESSFKRFFNDLETLSASERLGNMIAELEAYRQQTEVPSSSPFIVQTAAYQTIAENYREPYLEYIEVCGLP